MKDNKILIKIVTISFKIIAGIFIGLIVLPIKLLESRVGGSDPEYITTDINQDEL